MRASALRRRRRPATSSRRWCSAGTRPSTISGSAPIAERQLILTREQAEQLRAEAERAAADAAREIANRIAEAERKAGQLIAEAVHQADRIRAESERELAAATQRRDSINVQLAAVRQMLTTLTGASPGALESDQTAEAQPTVTG